MVIPLHIIIQRKWRTLSHRLDLLSYITIIIKLFDFNLNFKGSLNPLFISITDTTFYDDACHLKRCSQNKKQCHLTTTSQKMAAMNILCDRFHFKNHVDSWCKAHCNPNKFEELRVSLIIFIVKSHNKHQLHKITVLHNQEIKEP